MAKEIDIIKQGFYYDITVDLSQFPSFAQKTWGAALYNPTTKMRYVANTNSQASSSTKVFYWPAGLEVDEETGKLVLDDNLNSTARMTVGVYMLEIFTSDRSEVAAEESFAKVVVSNMMASNAEEEVDN